METSKGFEPSRNPMQPVLEVLQGGDPEAVCARYGITREDLDRLLAGYQESRRQAAVTSDLVLRKTNRNAPCPCGSGKKYKKCCLPKHEEARRILPSNTVQEMEQSARRKEALEKEIQKGFDLIFSQDIVKAKRLAEKLLKEYPEDDRLHDIVVSTFIADEDYDAAFIRCRERWQIAREEKDFFQENGHHKREGKLGHIHVYFYSPSTWLERFWIMQRARAYRSSFPLEKNPEISSLVAKLKTANDLQRFPGREDEGLAMRREALAPVVQGLIAAGPAAIPHLLPLTYQLSWASLFVPEILRAYDTEESIRLLAELATFRFPYFAQQCITFLEEMGERVIDPIDQILKENPVFDEMKTLLFMVLGSIPTPKSFAILAGFTEHQNPYVANRAAQALSRHENPDAVPYLEKVEQRVGAHSKVAEAIQDLVKPE